MTDVMDSSNGTVPIIELPHNPEADKFYFDDQLADSQTDHNEVNTGEVGIIEPVAELRTPVDVHVSVDHKHPGKFAKGAKTVACIGLVGLAVAGVLEVKDWVENFSFSSKHKVELAVGAPRTKVYKDVHLDLAGIDSTFAVSLHTSLDRPGPFNCDTDTMHTGKKDEDPKITTHTDAGLVLDSLTVTRDGDGKKVTAVAGGDIHLGRSSVDYDESTIKVHGADGNVDVCIGTSEVTSARHIDDIAIQHAGAVAAACALEDKAGKKAFDQGLAEFVTKTDLAKGVDPEAISVEMPDFDKSSAATYGTTAKEFNSAVNGAIDEYLAQTSNHEEPKINAAALLDCQKHDISFAK